jgi:hypothetical protein
MEEKGERREEEGRREEGGESLAKKKHFNFFFALVSYNIFCIWYDSGTIFMLPNLLTFCMVN